MEQPTDVILISPANNSRAQLSCSPLTRLIIPIEQIPDSLRLPVGRVWWCEAQGNRIWLRGYLQVEQAVEEVLLNGHTRYLVWYALPATAERLTLRGRACPIAADISQLIARQLPRITMQDFWISEISPDLAVELNRRREVIPESVWSFAAARQHYERLLRSLGRANKTSELAGNLDGAWAFARTELTRAELVKLEGCDVYTVAAAAIAGYSELPIGWTPRHNIQTTNLAQSPAFEELKVDTIRFYERMWVRSESAALPSDELERSSKHHQEILRRLAQLALAKGWQPTYNRFVDLRLALPDTEIFFEIKTTNEENFLHQVRLAAGQLLEYRFRYQGHDGDKSIQLVAVIENTGSDADLRFAGEFLQESGMRLLLSNPIRNEFTWWRDDSSIGLL